MLKSADEPQPELGLQTRERPAREAPRAALPGGAIGVARIAQIKVKRGPAVGGRQNNVGGGSGTWRTSAIGPQGLGASSAKGVSAWPATAQPRPCSSRASSWWVGTARQRISPT
jgi:hypothetical protein